MQLESATESQMSRRRQTPGNLSSSCHQTPARQRPIATATAQNLSVQLCLFGVMAGLTSTADVAPYGLDREVRRSTTISSIGSAATSDVSSVAGIWLRSDCPWRARTEPRAA